MAHVCGPVGQALHFLSTNTIMPELKYSCHCVAPGDLKFLLLIDELEHGIQCVHSTYTHTCQQDGFHKVFVLETSHI
jgi:hypothetical protein